ncbi:nucleotidyltransferase family protein [Dyadobacter luticola]|uniref:Nucleotidyltransferase family protein n=1 Tax=Dyadobacter luticola TaxID=1979387 RepID=A0A5R9KYW9_9BACT|nr:nucleotidyltransferase family protein [Dyadobacter luticola]TLV01285.1 nucleotidyltransferase family protein [Dyadobacter luticola]
MRQSNSYGIIILAAGSSSRLGQPKQLLEYQGKTLIRHVTEAALATVSNVVVVTGFNPQMIENELADLHCHFTENPHWEEGMASSIKSGLTKLQRLSPDVEGVIIAVSDQPFVTETLFQLLISQAENADAGIIASSYADTFGTPVLFTKKYFDALLELSGAEGAKKLLVKFANDAAAIPFPEGKIDIDTQEDYDQLLKNQK